MTTNKEYIENSIQELENIKEMIGKEADCFKIISQLKSTHQSLDKLINRFIEENILSCSVLSKNPTEKEKIKKLLGELNS